MENLRKKIVMFLVLTILALTAIKYSIDIYDVQQMTVIPNE